MKRIVASVGLVALGAAGVQAASPSPFDSEAPKPWSISAKLRGFYDDNFQTLPDNAKEGSAGFEVSPSFSLKWALEQTTISFNYVYGLKYYDKKPANEDTHYDQTHSFVAALEHTFNEKYTISLQDSFVIGQEPDVLRSGNSFASFQRISGENIRNSASIDFEAQLTKQFGLAAGYANSLTDYEDSDYSLNHTTTAPGVTVSGVTPSSSGTLDRMEQSFHLDGRWQVQPKTIAVLGYQFSDTSYTADQLIGGSVTNIAAGPNAGQTGQFYRSDVRNNRSHYGYLGVDQTFRADLSGSLRGGARYNEYYNDPYSQNEPSPYVNASLTYRYMAGSSVEVGTTYDRSATDLFSVDPGQSLTTDAQTLSAWVNVHQRITPRFTGTLTFQFQNSTYNGGTYNNETDQFYLVGLNCEYRFNHHFSAELGYNYDLLDSDISGRGFDRNRVYAGITATY